jgi:hypothetical protein
VRAIARTFLIFFDVVFRIFFKTYPNSSSRRAEMMFVLLLLDFAMTSTEIFNLLGDGIFSFSLLLLFLYRDDFSEGTTHVDESD